MLNRDRVQSSLRQQLGLGLEAPGVQLERGISKMMVDLYFVTPLSDKTMFELHTMQCASDRPFPCESTLTGMLQAVYQELSGHEDSHRG